ncbi:MAG: redox-regulated ATPase YchF [Bacteroidetes bacterium]|nr:redox-regulated ATPase YchF [Bacteroidota bacterium]
MSLKCGIVGLPNVGKSTLFNAISNSKATAANFPFATIEPNVGIVTVPDERIDKLVKLVNPEKTVPTTIEFVDIAGLVKGASKGEGLGNQFLANIREVDAIIHVIRCFKDDNIIHVAGNVDPIFDKEVIDHELQLKDLETITKRINKAEKNAKSGNKEAIKELDLLQNLEAHLNNNKNIRSYESNKNDNDLIKSWQLLTSKPVLYVANIDELSLKKGTNEYVESLKNELQKESSDIITLCASVESQIIELDIEDREIFLEEYNLKNSGLDKLIKAAYKLLNLITYFTAGVQEVRAWTIINGSKAPQAAGVIHTDFEKGFIKAEVIKFDDFIKLGSEQECKKAGKISIEGKDYIVNDGDIMHFRFNV